MVAAVLVEPLIGDGGGRPRGGRVAGDRGEESSRDSANTVAGDVAVTVAVRGTP